MAKKTTFVNFVLDETGSMQVCRDATISGFNEYIETLKQQSGKIVFTLTKFNSDRVKTVYNAVSIKDVVDLTYETYIPAALTPLYDAIGQTVREAEKAIEGMKSKPNVLCVIMTDGEENSSREFNRDGIFALIKEKEAAGWTFVYLGANQDAWEVGQSIGVVGDNTMSFAVGDTKGTFDRIATATVGYVQAGSRQTNKFFANQDEDS